MASIEIKGVTELIAKLGKVAAMATFRPPMERSMRRIQAEMKVYPPTRAGQTYRRGQDPRSEDLGGSWTVKVTQTRSGLTGIVGTNTSYAPWVQSHQFQAWMHKGRWQTDEDVIEQNRPAIVKDFQNVIDKVLK